MTDLTAIEERFPMGAKVRYFPVKGDTDFVNAEIRSQPWLLGSGHPVIMITGRTGGVSVDHLMRINPNPTSAG